MNPKHIARYIIRETLGIVGMGIALFWSAGQIDWWPAWASIGVMVGWILATAIIILRFNTDLLAERLGPRKGAKPWDTVIMSILGMAQLGRYIIAGLDQRYGWTEDFPLAVQITAFVMCALGYALFVWATASNPFFSQFVRVQSEDRHFVVKDGPYKYLRHPAYLGAIIYELAVSILLASWWALIASGFTTTLLILRTALEDRTLQNELAGYKDYMHKTRYRLLPYVW